LTLDILAAVAANEIREISKRTKAALATGKKPLGARREGHPKLMPEMSRMGSVASAKSRAKAAAEAYSDIVDQMRELQASGLSLRAIAARLTADGH
jgi:DNA invertase Pin-like site-specific DNA recombinase